MTTTTTFSTSHRPRSKRRARLHLPPLHADEALLIVGILEKAIQAIWRTHGDAMADRLAAAGIETPRPEDARWDGHPAGDDIAF